MKDNPTISLTLIIKDEQKNMERLLPMAKPFFDEIIIVDTGSTDSSIEVCKEHGAKVFEYDAREDLYGTGELVFNFSKARNYALDQATMDWVMWLDADDLIFGFENLPELMRSGKKLFLAKYITGKDSMGNVTVFSQRERMWERGLIRWQWFIHENGAPQRPLGPDEWGYTDLIWVEHAPEEGHSEVSTERNLTRIKEYIDHLGIDNVDVRYINILADSYYGAGHWQEGIDAYNAYEAHNPNSPITELYENCTKRGDCYLRMDKPQEALKEYFQQLQMMPNRPEAYCLIGSVYEGYQDYKRAIEWLEIGVSKPPYNENFLNNRAIYTYVAWNDLAFSYAKEGRFTESLQAYAQARELGAGDVIKQDEDAVKELWKKNYMVEKYVELADLLRASDHSKLGHLLLSIPKEIRDDPRLQILKPKA